MSNHLKRCSELARELFKLGVRHAVISPGSRSTPLTAAFANHPGFKKTIILDERSAAFTALGIGKESGVPAILICTSGTALANYFPAVIEARQSGVPMIILSADRPPNLRGTGSSQTIDQLKIFGDYAVLFHEMGESQYETQDRKRDLFAARQAYSESIRKGGAAHLNFPFRKPLEPGEEDLRSELKDNEAQIRSAKKKEKPVSVTVTPSDHLTELINNSEKPLIIAGPSNPAQTLSKLFSGLADKLNAPAIIEPGAGLDYSEYSIQGFEQFLRNPDIVENLEPDLIIRIGDQPFTKSVNTFLERFDELFQLHFMQRLASQDSTMTVNETIYISKNDHFDLSAIKQKTARHWLDEWKSEGDKAIGFRKNHLDENTVFTDGHIFNHFSSSKFDGWNVMLSNSFPVRDMALFGKSKPGQFVNRGAAGIDGISSTALGIALSGSRPVLCLTGDLAFLHDSNALLSLKKSETPLVIVIINNGGGTIFRMLPIYGRKEIYDTYFETPQDVNISDLAAAHKLQYRKINSLEEFLNFDMTEQKEFPLILECITDADASMALRKKLWNH